MPEISVIQEMATSGRKNFEVGKTVVKMTIVKYIMLRERASFFLFYEISFLHTHNMKTLQ